VIRCVLSWTLEIGLDNGVQNIEEGTLAIMTKRFPEHIKEKDGSTNEL